MGKVSSMVKARVKVAPSSDEKATRTTPLATAPVNHATAVTPSRVSTAGPFTGHAAISQPSSWIVLGAVQPSVVRRTTEMSRTSSSSRSR